MNERGAVAAEFALIAGLVALLLMAMIELGLMLESQLALDAAARETARLAAVEGGVTRKVLEAARQQSSLGAFRGILSRDPEALAISIRPRQARVGSRLTIELRLRYPWRTAMFRSLVGAGITLRATAVTRSERDR